MRNTFGMSKLDAICFIAHNTKMTDVSVGALTGNSPEWVREVRERMGNHTGEHMAKLYDKAFRLIENLHEKAKELNYCRWLLEDAYKDHRANNSPSSALCIRFRNRSHDKALKEFTETKRLCVYHIAKIKLLYRTMPICFTYLRQPENSVIDYKFLNEASRIQDQISSRVSLFWFIMNCDTDNGLSFFERMLNLDSNKSSFVRTMQSVGSVSEAMDAKHVHIYANEANQIIGSIGKIEPSPYVIPSVQKEVSEEDKKALREAGNALIDYYREYLESK